MKTWCAKRPRSDVALLIESSRSYGRGLLVGIARYMRIHRSWSIKFEEGDPVERVPPSINQLKLDGIIARVKTLAMAQSLRRKGIPVVDLYGSIPRLGFPCIRSDENAVGRMAAEHLLDRGFRRFAFCGYNGTEWSDLRRMGFEKRVAEAGFSCQNFVNLTPARSSAGAGDAESGTRHEKELTHWLKSLPKPIGLMACNDSRGRQVLDSCLMSELAVPDDIAVIGVDSDEVMCELSSVSLTSVILNTQQIGYQAAALLDRLMAGEAIDATTPILVKPQGIATHQSTDVLAIDDRSIAAVLRLIREHACEGINVPFLAKSAGLSRRVLERRLTAALGRSPNAEILRVRLDCVCRLLAETDFSLSDVAEKTGFNHAEYLSRLFRKRFGMTPGQYRRKEGVVSKAERS